MFQTKHHPNYTRIRERGENGALGVGRGFDLSMQSIFGDNLFTDKNLLKQARYLAFPNKNLTSSIINNVKIH